MHIAITSAGNVVVVRTYAFLRTLHAVHVVAGVSICSISVAGATALEATKATTDCGLEGVTDDSRQETVFAAKVAFLEAVLSTPTVIPDPKIGFFVIP